MARASRRQFPHETPERAGEAKFRENAAARALTAQWKGILRRTAEVLLQRYPTAHSNEPWQALHRTDCDLRRPFQSGKALSGVPARKNTTITVAAVFPVRKCGKTLPTSQPCASKVRRFRAISRGFLCSVRIPRDSGAPCRFLTSRDFRERPGICADGFRDGLAVDKLPLAA